MPVPEPALALRGVVKDYRGLRPLRIQALDLAEGRSLALLGFDQAMAEVLVRLIMGASVPDEGEVIVFGRSTRAIADGDEWLGGLSRFGLLSDRAVLVEELTAAQTLAMPISFDVGDPVVRQTVDRLAREVGLAPGVLDQPVGTLPPAARVRVRLGRALAADPRLLLAEHPSATLPPEDAPGFAADLVRAVSGRGIASVVCTADPAFAAAAATRVLTLRPATGELSESSGWRRWFG